MFLAIPLENKPSWQNPPWLTILLVLINVIVYFGPQASEDRALARAANFYVQSGLAELEFDPFREYLQKRYPQDAQNYPKILTPDHAQDILWRMSREKEFLSDLRQYKIITPQHQRFEAWRKDRARFEAKLPAPFTSRWAVDFQSDVLQRPETWISAAFLHGSVSHLVGNMVFLCLFGFTVELALGRVLFLSFYLLSALGAGAFAALMYHGQPGNLVGASGAIAAVMSMYVILYRWRRISFFVWILFYFNMVKAPALLLLPLWILSELIQHYTVESHVAYMGHLGGLLTGAALMMAFPATRRQRAPVLKKSADDRFQALLEQAQSLSSSMKLEEACTAFERVVSMRPEQFSAVQHFFNLACLWPAKPGFHRAASAVFRLRGSDSQTVDFQHKAFKTYFDKAKPHARLAPQETAHLCRQFAAAGYLDDANKLCHASLAFDPRHEDIVDLLSACALACLRGHRTELALAWLPELERRAPRHPTTLHLKQLRGT